MDKEKILQMRPEDEDLEVMRLFTLLNLDEEFAKNPYAKVINNETLVSQKLSKEFTDAIYSNSDGELGFAPTCQCGAVRGATKEGLYCSLCNTVCSSQFIDSLSHISWVGIPECMPPVMHPIWYLILKPWTSIGRRDISIIDIILNPEEEIPEDLAPYIKGRGFEYFHNNSEAILDTLLYQYPKTAKKPAAKWVEHFRKAYRHLMFTRKLPILHNSLHPLKCNGGTLNYVDSESKNALTAVINLSTETFKMHATTVTFKQFNKMLFEIYTQMITYYQSLIVEKLGGKQAMLRKHCYGSRIHFSMRSVVVPQDTVFRMDEVQLPWGIIVNGLKLPILNHLMNRHHKPLEEALTIFMNSLTHYDPLVDKCVETFIKECPGGKLPILLGRNPTLAYGSIMLLFVPVHGYKKNPGDETIAINACIIEPANIDFDGDELFGAFVFENYLRKRMRAVHPSQFLFSTTEPGLSTRIGLLKQNIVLLENYLSEEEDIDYYEEIS